VPPGQLGDRVHRPPVRQLTDQQEQPAVTGRDRPVGALRLRQQLVLVEITDRRQHINRVESLHWLVPAQISQQGLGRRSTSSQLGGQDLRIIRILRIEQPALLRRQALHLLQQTSRTEHVLHPSRPIEHRNPGAHATTGIRTTTGTSTLKQP
jgi:hypothetical protein